MQSELEELPLNALNQQKALTTVQRISLVNGEAKEAEKVRQRQRKTEKESVRGERERKGSAGFTNQKFRLNVNTVGLRLRLRTIEFNVITEDQESL